MRRAIEAPPPLEVSRPFLERLSPAARARLTLSHRRVRYPAGTVPWQHGDPMPFAVLASGMVRVFIGSANGNQATVRFVRSGELLGMTITPDAPFPIAVQVVTDAVAHYLDPDVFMDLLRTDNDVALALAAELGWRYVSTIRAATVLIFGTIEQKVAFDLLERACREQLTSGRLVIRVSHQEIADSINSSREAVTRAMAELRGARLIGSTKGATALLDPARLEEVAWRGIAAHM